MSQLDVRPKQSVWTRPIKLRTGELFTTLGKTIVHVATGNWSALSEDAVDTIAAFGVAEDAAEQAGVLLSRAMTRAIMELIDPYKMDFPAELDTAAGLIAKQIDSELSALEIRIDERFLERPRELELVGVMQAKVEAWLGHVNLRGRSATTIAARLGSHFVHALHRECVMHDYSLLFRELDGEFSPAWQRERSWLAYQDWFRRELEAPVFGEAFGLAQIFIWPRTYSIEGEKQSRGRRGQPESADHTDIERRNVGDLRSYLDTWMRGGFMTVTQQREDAIRIISGDPGAGKSSFARMYAMHRMDQGDRVLFVPLHRMDVGGDLGSCLASLCDEIDSYPKHVDLNDERILLILDGLDELAKRGKVGALLAAEFVDEVWRTVTNRNRDGVQLRVIISGRPIAIQNVESKFRRPGQILYVLPYCVQLEGSSSIEWVDSRGRLAVDQRQDWWRRYGELTGRDYVRLPATLAGDSLVETTSQPLLGYLLALVYENAAASGQDFERDVSRNEIYSQLIDQVYERDWDKRPGGYIPLGGLNKRGFRDLLEDMALAAWHDRERVTTIAAVERLHPGVALREYSETTGSIGHLFTAFYMRRRGQRHDGEDTLEFTHKSFAEYLTANRLVAQLDVAAQDLADHDATGRARRSAGKDEMGVLVEWLKIFGPRELSLDLLSYLVKEVALRGGDGRAQRWQLALIRLIEQVLREGSPCERLSGAVTYIEACRWARNAEEALLVMLHCCSEVTEEISNIAWPEPTSFGAWIRRLRTQQGAVEPTCTGAVLTRLNIEGQVFDGVDLSHARLCGSRLVKARARFAVMVHADFAGTDLECANLEGANLRFAQFWDSNLRSAQLMGADLRTASLRNTDLSDARLDKASLDRSTTLSEVEVTAEQIRSATGEPLWLFVKD